MCERTENTNSCDYVSKQHGEDAHLHFKCPYIAAMAAVSDVCLLETLIQSNWTCLLLLFTASAMKDSVAVTTEVTLKINTCVRVEVFNLHTQPDTLLLQQNIDCHVHERRDVTPALCNLNVF